MPLLPLFSFFLFVSSLYAFFEVCLWFSQCCLGCKAFYLLKLLPESRNVRMQRGPTDQTTGSRGWEWGHPILIYSIVDLNWNGSWFPILVYMCSNSLPILVFQKNQLGRLTLFSIYSYINIHHWYESILRLTRDCTTLEGSQYWSMKLWIWVISQFKLTIKSDNEVER